jgi:hypothetical protein
MNYDLRSVKLSSRLSIYETLEYHILVIRKSPKQQYQELATGRHASQTRHLRRYNLLRQDPMKAHAHPMPKPRIDAENNNNNTDNDGEIIKKTAAKNESNQDGASASSISATESPEWI